MREQNGERSALTDKRADAAQEPEGISLETMCGDRARE
jgi:hypothetical protein